MPHTELQAVFDEHAKPTHCCKREVHDQMAPIAAVAASARQQVARYKALLIQAQLAPHDTDHDFKLESIKQTIGAIERSVTQLEDAGHAVAMDFTQLDRYMAEWPQEIARMEAIKADPAARATPSVP